MFRVTLACEDDAVGRLLRLTYTLGKLLELTPIGAEEVPKALGNGHASPAKLVQLAGARAAKAARHGSKARKKPLLRDTIMAEHAAAMRDRRPVADIILEALSQRPHQLAELKPLAMDAGYGASTASVTIRTLEMQGRVKRIAPGRYALSDDPAPGIEPAPRIPPKRGLDSRRRAVDVILDALRDGAPHTRAEMGLALATEGFDPAGVGGRLHDVLRQGKIERVGEGKYQLKQEPQHG
jgi:hypothetical protein